jgi:hypothetical protein
MTGYGQKFRQAYFGFLGRELPLTLTRYREFLPLTHCAAQSCYLVECF